MGDAPGLIERWKEAAAGEPDARRRATFGDAALTLSEAADRKAIWQKGLEGWEMKVSSVAEGWRAEGHATSLLDLLRARFPGQVTPEVEQRVRTQGDIDTLRRWFLSAVTIPTLADFL